MRKERFAFKENDKDMTGRHEVQNIHYSTTTTTVGHLLIN